MKFVTYTQFDSDLPRFGFKKGKFIVDVLRAAIWAKQSQNRNEFLDIPTSLKRTLEQWHFHYRRLQKLSELVPSMDLHSYTANEKPIAMEEKDVTLHSPIPNPSTFRDFYAFEQHVKSARKLRGLEMDPTWYELPVFYFSNPNALFGHGAPIPYPVGSLEMDFELEIGIIIGQGGKNISASDADYYIAGYTIINDWSARDFQRQEMKLNLGPAKGKDFATSVGPYMVTPDELSHVWSGNKMQLRMTCHVNGIKLSDGNTNDMYHSFATMIEHASRNAELKPGDIIGSGTVGTGCILELRPENTNGWLKSGDKVDCEIEQLGKLENTISSS